MRPPSTPVARSLNYLVWSGYERELIATKKGHYEMHFGGTNPIPDSGGSVRDRTAI